jgi:drug/metabolite transporter (DMT)-like permease
MQKAASHRSNHIKLLAGVVAISFSPLAVKLVVFSTSASAFYRSFYAALFFLILSLWQYKKQPWTQSRAWQLPSAIAGLFLGIDLIVWHKTIVYLGVGPATFLGNSQIIFVTLFAALVFREKIPIPYYVTVAVVMIGLFMLTPSSSDRVSRPYGFLLGLIVGFTYAGMLIGLRYAKALSGKGYPELLSLSLLFGFSALTIAVYIYGFEQGSLAEWDYRSHVLMALTAFFCQTIGWYLINNNIVKIPAHEGSLMLMLQPLLATVWGVLVFSEQLGPVQAAGMAITLVGIAMYQTKYASKKVVPSGFEE